MTKNVLVLSAYTDNILWENYGKNDYAEISLEQNKKYAEKNNYDFKYVKYKLNEIDSNFGPTWIKIKAILDNIDNYEYIFWIDADAIFVKNASIDFLLGKDFVVTKALNADGYNETFTVTSSGLMLIKNTEFSKNILNNLINQSSIWKKGIFKKEYWHEQGLLDDMYIIPQIISTYKFNEDYYRLINKSTEDISCGFETNNFKIIPAKFQSSDKDKIEFVFHAGGDTPSKGTRIQSVIDTKNNVFKNNNINYFIDKKIKSINEIKYKKVYIAFDSRSLGDTIAWIPYVEEFRKKHNCKVVVSTFLNKLFEKEYPDIEFIKPGTVVFDIDKQYNIGWYSPWDPKKNPNHYTTVPLQQTASDILGLDFKEIKPKITIPSLITENKKNL